MKRTIELISVVAIAMALTIAFSGVALASQPVPPTKETETLEITTTITCTGDVVESQRLDLESSSMNLLDNPPLETKNSTYTVGNSTYEKEVVKKVGEVYGKIKYDEKMIASSGTTEFDKCFEVDTGTTPNLDVHKQIGYTQGVLGSLSHEEQVSMKIIALGSSTTTTTKTFTPWLVFEPWKQDLCPFKEEEKEKESKVIPGSCEEVNVYSKIVVTDVQATTETSVGITAAPVNLKYRINAVGTGLVIAGVGVYVEDGRGYSTLGSRMAYTEKSIGYGESVDFTKDIGYKSVVSP